MAEQNIEDLFEDRARKGDGQFAVAFAIMQSVRQQKNIAHQLERLGLGNASSSMGAIELLSMSVRDGFEAMDSAIRATIED